ncbi:MAG: carbon monoxide dehydrogenase subunit G [Rhodospirillales bacterium]|nr:carbon monoxide dehydrogenase subunit G [Rhodospirillales bacterium]
MELNAEQKIAATREQVFAALNDPAILMQCIPGCESLEKESDTEMTATVVLRVGPVKAKFKGRVELSNLVPPESYSIRGEGAGGPAGYAKGGADIKLLEDGDGTILQYDVKADVGGKLAQLGGRLIDSTAKNLSGKFFAKFCEIVEADLGVDTQATISEAPVAADSKAGRSLSPLIWVVLGAGVLALYFAFS